jgi:hypothetical protein
MEDIPERIDWKDEVQVKAEAERALERFKYLKKCASSDGNICPVCGSSRVEVLDEDEPYYKNLIIRKCLDCHIEYSQFNMMAGEKEFWSEQWPFGLTSFLIQDYPFYLYFRPRTTVYEGIGPEAYPL